MDSGFDLAFGGHATFSATYYSQYATDLIDGVTLDADMAPEIQQFQNVGTVHNTGIELEGSLRLPVGRLSAEYAIANSRVDALGPEYGGDLQIGDQLLGIPIGQGVPR